MRRNYLPYLAIATTILLWASAFPAIRVALSGYRPAEAALLRYLVASAALVLFALVRRIPLPDRRDVPAIALAGLVGFTLYNVLLNAGELTVSAGIASFIISGEVGLIALLAHVFYGERLRFAGWLGVVLCITGIGIISLGGEEGLRLSPGALLVFGATIAISVYSVMQKPLLRRYSALQFTTYAIWAGTFFLLFFAPGALGTVASAAPDATWAVVYMGLLPGVLAYTTWSYALSQVRASEAGAYLALVPVAALVISWLWLGEVPKLVDLLGGVVVLLGIIMVNLRRGK